MKNGLVIDEYGNKFWYKDDKLHREDGPAYECVNGTKEWWINGRCHRIDGPAVEYADGSKEWWINGELHRLGGPAIECSGRKYWFYQGKKVDCKSQEEFELWLRLEELKAFW